CQGLLRGVHMNLDAPDAELLDQTLDTIAAGLKAAGDTDDHQARRAKAVGTLLDPQLAMDFLNGTLPDTGSDGTTKTKTPGTPSRVANVYVHCSLSDLATMTSAGVDYGASIEKLGPITLARMSEWLTRPGGVGSGRINVRPVIDTNTDQAVDQHDPPQWMREAMILRDDTCVFPGCTTTARACDADHIEPYVPMEDGGSPGQTSLANLALLCRSHHRLKTHMGWTYQRRSDGTYEWWDRWARPVRESHDLDHSGARDLDAARWTKTSAAELYLHDFLIEYAGPGGTDPPT
ncbi:HNH endonuclease signature motif containing protein, partial [Nocardioides massiliensis]